MGFNSMLFIINDHVHVIDEHPEEFWREAWRALTSGEPGREIQVQGRTVGEAVFCSHADIQQAVLAGGNNATVIWSGYRGIGGNGDAESQVHMLKEIAESYGYRLVKTSSSKILRQINSDEADLVRRSSRASRDWMHFMTSKIAHLKALLTKEKS